MIIAWIGFGAMTLTLALVLASPLFENDRPASEISYALAVYRDQLEEVDRDARLGILDEVLAGPARIEVERRILAIADVSRSRLPKRPFAAIVIAMSVALPIAGLCLYLELGRPDLLNASGPVLETASPVPSLGTDSAKPSNPNKR
jgi:cytochrome c-type biogenesis protein CcmH